MNLSADLIARAIVAAARSYGDDPVRACTSASNSKRRALTAAVSGVCRALDLRPQRVAPILGLSPNAIVVARAPSQRTAGFDLAERAARDAVAPFVAAAEPALKAEACPPPVSLPQRAAEARFSVALRRPAPLPDVSEPGPEAPVSKPRLIEPAILRDAPESLRGRILSTLKDAPTTAPSLAILTDAKELSVIEALTSLVREGRVEGGPVNPQFGARHREWRLRGGVA